jgi:molecular chaperone GrpE
VGERSPVLSEDPVDQPDGPEAEDDAPDTRAPEASVDAALEPPPQADPAEHLERRARLAEDRLAEVLNAYRQFKTENEGYRERVKRDLGRRSDERHERLLLQFIDILDNLDRALEAAEQTFAGNPLIEGLILVRTQLLQTLQQQGLERIPVLGLPFDPAYSEAVGTLPVSDLDHDHVVVRELLRGYRLNGRVARASRVLVGQYDETAAASPEPDDLIGTGEEPPVAEVETAAETLPLDEETIRAIFGPDEDEPEST